LSLLLISPSFTIQNDSEDDLPVYLKGIGWRDVEAELRKDLRLSNSIRPTRYEVRLNVSVRGYEGAEKSTFRGSVFILLNVSSPIDIIELHSVDLAIEKARILAVGEEVLSTGEVKYHPERETISIPSKRMIQKDEIVLLQIFYNGIVQMNGAGLYESWTTREDSNDPETPTISLVTSGEPTGARLWIPCFDEPDKKATFTLVVHHPKELSVYSNSFIQRSQSDRFSRKVTFFKRTNPLPTYLFALAVTKQKVATTDKYVKRHRQFRAIGKNKKSAIIEFISAFNAINSIKVFENVTYFPEKNDIIIVDDYPERSAMENPGLITAGRKAALEFDTLLHEIA
ncbi:hypothetical protein PFISCL1PPCAC_5574, partial [Pristionchus fissidentatus]